MSSRQKNLEKCISDAYGYMSKKCTGSDVEGVQTHFKDNLHKANPVYDSHITGK